MAVDADISARLEALEAKVAALQQELVTQRVAVVDDQGVARVVLSAARQSGSVLVRLDGPAGATTGVELVASEPDHEAPLLGIALLSRGDVVAFVEPGVSGEP